MNAWKSSMIRYFTEGIKQNGGSMLGVEIEHFILKRENHTAVPYSGDSGVRNILCKLMEQYPEAAVLPDDDFFGFRVPDFIITLEPAAQLEISIRPAESIQNIERIYRTFFSKLSAVLAEYDYTAVTSGCHPVSRVAELEMIPKRRYDLMNEYFQTSGTGGMEMMRGTASLQVSIDYRSEQDFRKKIQAASYYAPLLKMLCDNSSSFQGEPLRIRLKRTDIWRRVDPARCGILPDVFSDSYGFENYADFLGAMPPIFLKKDRAILPTGSRTVAELFEGREMNEDEITHILSMAFPDIRLKQFLEIRFADSVPVPYITAYCAMIKGLLYSDEGLAFAQDQIRRNGISEANVRQAEDALMKDGWNALVYGHRAAEMAQQLVKLARRNLPENERTYPDIFETVIASGGICNIAKDIT